ncbi:MAG: cysteine--tRNA ligase [Nocardioides sp.]|nr:cysteine--tRNA ligase [Nocardioides sp.]
MPHEISSGVVGLAGRVPDVDPRPLLSSALTLGGSPLPLTGRARIYTCGITPYDVTHLGHAATFVWADLLASVVRAAGLEPEVCRNVTDVDDVLTAAASGHGRPYDEFALSQEFRFERDMRALGVARPAHAPHARGHVTHVVQLAAALLRTGAAYEHEGTVWFRGEAAFRTSGLSEDDALARLREFGDEPGAAGSESPWDVPVWRPSPAEHPAWPSPWGWGRPGWHAECAAMCWTTFGPSIDVLGGGEDLAFPHHAYQAAMVEAASGATPYARAHFRVGSVMLDGAKMAKSTKNLVLVSDLLEDHTGPAIRMMLLHRRWSEAWDYTPALLTEAEQRLGRLYAAGGRTGGEDAVETVLGALLDDLDVVTACALAEEHGGAAARTLISVLRIDHAG